MSILAKPGSRALLASLALSAAFPLYADLDPQAAPGANFDLSHWKLTIPVDANGTTTGTAVDILPSSLEASTPYSSSWFFTLTSDGGMRFWAPVNGAKTGNTDYPRSELRELLDPSDDNVNWTSTGNSVLDARLAVNTVPSSTLKVVVGQIHGFNTAPLVKLRFQYSTSSQTGKIDALVNVKPTDTTTTSFPLATGLVLNKDFYYHISVSAGVLSMSVNGATPTTLSIDPSWAGTGFYFKAGVYDQASGTSATDGGTVTFYRLAASHPNNKLKIDTSAVSDATAGSSYAQALSGSGGSGGGLWSLVSGQLPKGLKLDASSGMLSGTPSSSTADGSTHQFSVLLTDPAGDTSAKTYSMSIAAP